MEENNFDENGNINLSVFKSSTKKHWHLFDLLFLFWNIKFIQIGRYSKPIIKIYCDLDQFLSKINRDFQHYFKLTFLFLSTLISAMFGIFIFTTIWINISWNVKNTNL